VRLIDRVLSSSASGVGLEIGSSEWPYGSTRFTVDPTTPLPAAIEAAAPAVWLLDTPEVKALGLRSSSPTPSTKPSRGTPTTWPELPSQLPHLSAPPDLELLADAENLMKRARPVTTSDHGDHPHDQSGPASGPRAFPHSRLHGVGGAPGAARRHSCPDDRQAAKRRRLAGTGEAKSGERQHPPRGMSVRPLGRSS